MPARPSRFCSIPPHTDVPNAFCAFETTSAELATSGIPLC